MSECDREAWIMGKPNLVGVGVPLKKSGEECVSGSGGVVRNMMIVRRFYGVIWNALCADC